MSLRNKANFVGDVGIISGTAAFVLVIFSMFYEIQYAGIGIFVLMIIYSEMKTKYRKLRAKEIDEDLISKCK